MKKNIIIFSVTAIMVLVAGCKKETDDNSTDKIKITEATAADGLKAILWADKSELNVGYNKIYLSLSDNSGDLEGYQISINPIMDMGMMQHGCPVEQPVFEQGAKLYSGAIAFNMASSEMGNWKLRVDVDGRSVTLDISVISTPTNTKHIGSFMGTDSVNYTISLVQPMSPKTGMNDLEILVNKREDLFTYPSVDGLTVEFYPEMTSMGHSSPNNENPVNTGNGRYLGKVNYTMTGDWRLFFTIKKNGQAIVTDTYLDILF